VARHLSFARAAGELSVTPGAVSQQIKLLEDYYGVALFRRNGRHIALTNEALDIVPELSTAFDLLVRATARLQSQGLGGIVNVTVPPTFAVKWLAQRLGDFTLAHPGVQIRVESTERLVDLRREQSDIAIRYGGGSWDGLHADHLFDERLMPVCSPAYIKINPMNSLEDLVAARLIHDRTMLSTRLEFPDWNSWLADAGVEAPEEGALQFSSSLAAIQAAIDGHGVILGRSALIDDELKNGRLIAPFERTSWSGYGYYVVSLDQAPLAPRIETFRQWLLDEAVGYDRRL
jgi:LysR family glycine cleavage system transcriptional activator